MVVIENKKTLPPTNISKSKPKLTTKHKPKRAAKNNQQTITTTGDRNLDLDLDQQGIKKIVADAPNGRYETNFALTKKVRTYATHKPSEPSVEYTNDAGKTPLVNLEFTYYVRINGFKGVTDAISSKVLGGHHTSSNPPEGTCYDVQIDIFGDASQNLEVERPHPKMHECNQKPQTTLGEKLVGKYIGVKAITYLINGGKDRRVQEWIDYPVPDISKPPNNWRMLFSVDDTGQLPSGHIIKPFGSLTTSRIDGVWKGAVNKNPQVSDVSTPDFKYASVREIQADGGGPPPPPPTPTPVECPKGQHAICVPDVIPEGLSVSDLNLITTKNVPLRVVLAATDSNHQAVISFAINTQPTNGILKPDTATGVYEYNPAKDWVGSDSFVYTASDDKGQKAAKPATVSITITATPGPGGGGGPTDVFGIAKIYADKVGTYNNWDMRDNTRWYEQTPVDAGGGWFTYKSLHQGRIEVVPEAGLKDTDIDTYYADTILRRGYFHKPNNSPDGKGDWGGPGVGLELTVRYRNVSLSSGSYEAHPEFVWGGFRQSTNSSSAGKDGKVVVSCEAASYHANLYYKSNRCKFERDVKHTDGYSQHDPEFHGVVNIDGRAEHIHKAVFYTIPNPNVLGGYSVVLEQYLSTDLKNFTQIGRFIDDGTSWGPSKGNVANSCGYSSEKQPLNMAKCTPGIRIDFMSSFEFKDFSIRTVDPAIPVHTAAKATPVMSHSAKDHGN